MQDQKPLSEQLVPERDDLPKIKLQVEQATLVQVQEILDKMMVNQTGVTHFTPARDTSVYAKLLRDVIAHVLEQFTRAVPALLTIKLQVNLKLAANHDEDSMSIVFELVLHQQQFPITVKVNKQFLKQIDNDELLRVSQLIRDAINKRCVLIVDDSSINSLCLKTIIERFLVSGEYTICMVEDGKQGLEFVETNLCVMVFMDYHMPIMDGITSAVAIRKFNQAVPIVFISAEANAIEKQRMAEVDKSEICGKPFTRDNVLAVIKKYELKVSEQQQAGFQK